MACSLQISEKAGEIVSNLFLRDSRKKTSGIGVAATILRAGDVQIPRVPSHKHKGWLSRTALRGEFRPADQRRFQILSATSSPWAANAMGLGNP
jgi:hypothetical protein